MSDFGFGKKKLMKVAEATIQMDSVLVKEESAKVRKMLKGQHLHGGDYIKLTYKFRYKEI